MIMGFCQDLESALLSIWSYPILFWKNILNVWISDLIMPHFSNFYHWFMLFLFMYSVVGHFNRKLKEVTVASKCSHLIRKSIALCTKVKCFLPLEYNYEQAFWTVTIFLPFIWDKSLYFTLFHIWQIRRAKRSCKVKKGWVLQISPRLHLSVHPTWTHSKTSIYKAFF